MKENFLVVALFGGFAVAIGLFVFSLMQLTSSRAEAEFIKQERIDELEAKVAAAPLQPEIDAVANRRIAGLRAAYYDHYLRVMQASWPLRTWLIPGTDEINDPRIEARSSNQLVELALIYGKYKNIPPEAMPDVRGTRGIDSMDPAIDPWQQLEPIADKSLMHKRFWIAMELVMALGEAVEEAKRVNSDIFADREPTLFVREIAMDESIPTAEDGIRGLMRGAFLGIGVRLTLAADPEVLDALGTVLRNPPPPSATPPSDFSGRIGILFDRISTLMTRSAMQPDVVIDFGVEPFISKMQEMGATIGGTPVQVVPPDGTSEQAFTVNVIRESRDLIEAKIANRSWIEAEITMRALEFYPIPRPEFGRMANFFRYIFDGYDDEDVVDAIAEMIERGEGETEHTCEVTGEPTTNLPVITPDNPFVERYLSTEAIRDAAREIAVAADLMTADGGGDGDEE
jgi:hypothetical protein